MLPCRSTRCATGVQAPDFPVGHVVIASEDEAALGECDRLGRAAQQCGDERQAGDRLRRGPIHRQVVDERHRLLERFDARRGVTAEPVDLSDHRAQTGLERAIVDLAGGLETPAGGVGGLAEPADTRERHRVLTLQFGEVGGRVIGLHRLGEAARGVFEAEPTQAIAGDDHQAEGVRHV